MFCKNTILQVIRDNQGKTFEKGCAGEISRLSSKFSESVYSSAVRGNFVSKETYARKVYKHMGNILFGNLRQYSKDRLVILSMVTKEVTDKIFISARRRLRHEALEVDELGSCANIKRYPRTVKRAKGVPALSIISSASDGELYELYSRDSRDDHSRRENRIKKWVEILNAFGRSNFDDFESEGAEDTSPKNPKGPKETKKPVSPKKPKGPKSK